MKNITSILMTMLAVCFCANAYEHSNNHKKIYVTPKNVVVMKKGIRVQLKENFFLVKNLRADKNGIFVLPSEISSVEKSTYQCPVCGRLFGSRSAFTNHRLYGNCR